MLVSAEDVAALHRSCFAHMCGSCRQAWAEVTRFKTFKKRTLRMTTLTLGGFSIGIQLFKMVAKAKKGKTFQLHAVTNDELITESALIDQDTGVCGLRA